MEDKSVQILNCLAKKLSATEISKQLKVSTRTIYELKEALPLFGGFTRDRRDNIQNIRKRRYKPRTEV